MNAYQLQTPECNPFPVWVCGECSRIHTYEVGAKNCCICQFCGLQVENSYHHTECWNKDRATKDAKTLESAALLEVYDGHIYAPGFSGGNDSFYESLEDFIDNLYADEVTPELWPSRVHTCKSVPFPTIDISDIINNISDNGFEGIADHLSGEKELEEAIDVFNKANAHILGYEPDLDHAVSIPPWLPKCQACDRSGMIRVNEVDYDTCTACAGAGRVKLVS